jgi:N-methylhydantoinase B/oxoprolinase/acetone carboxylase alpha subunit
MPARAIGDGEDTRWSIYNPMTDQGNAEINELIFPYVYLGRRLAKGSAGMGEYRGGLGFNSVWMIQNTPGIDYQAGDLGVRTKTLSNDAMFGGYPAQTDRVNCTINSDVEEYVEERLPLIHERGDPADPEINKFENAFAGETIPFSSPEDLTEFDIIEYVAPGSQSFGDPLDRDIEMIEDDLNSLREDAQTARNVYAVAVEHDEEADEWKVDEEETETLREQEREDRLERASHFSEWWDQEREKIRNQEGMAQEVGRMLDESMELSEDFAEEFRQFWDLPDDFTFASAGDEE